MLDGQVEAVDPTTNERYGEATLGPTQFFGDIGFLNGGPITIGARRCATADCCACRARRC